MSDAPRTGLAPMGVGEGSPHDYDPASTGRQSSRVSERQSARPYTPPEPHLKYEIPEDRRDPSKDYLWLPTHIVGAPNPRISEYYRAGWIPSTAEQFPEISGYGTEYPQKLVDLGLLTPIQASDPLIKDNMMLVERPISKSAEARRREREEARDRVDTQMRALHAQYRTNFSDGGIKRAVRPLTDE